MKKNGIIYTRFFVMGGCLRIQVITVRDMLEGDTYEFGHL